MFKKKLAPEPTANEKAIAECYSALAGYDEDSKEYAKIVKRITELSALENTTKKSKIKLPSPDAALTALTGLAGILLILNYERANVVTSKAMGFVHKPKL